MLCFERTRWNDIFDQLVKSGFDVYPPAIKSGICKAPYVVVSLDGGNRFGELSTVIDFYEIACMVPGDQYSHLESFVQQVEAALVPLSPGIQNEYEKQGSLYDPQIDAHVVSFRLRNYKKLEGVMPKEAY